MSKKPRDKYENHDGTDENRRPSNSKNGKSCENDDMDISNKKNWEGGETDEIQKRQEGYYREDKDRGISNWTPEDDPTHYSKSPDGQSKLYICKRKYLQR